MESKYGEVDEIDGTRDSMVFLGYKKSIQAFLQIPEFKLDTNELEFLINFNLHGIHMLVRYTKNAGNSEFEVQNIEELPLRYY